MLKRHHCKADYEFDRCSGRALVTRSNLLVKCYLFIVIIIATAGGICQQLSSWAVGGRAVGRAEREGEMELHRSLRLCSGEPLGPQSAFSL